MVKILIIPYLNKCSMISLRKAWFQYKTFMDKK
jgi:hypothetical protein